MSRTDIHRPWWVIQRDPLMRRHLRVEHNHWEHGPWDETSRSYPERRPAPCDLHVLLGAVHEPPRTRCYIQPAGGLRLCGCPLCTGQAGRKQNHRRERTWWRTQRRHILATAREDHDTLDVAPFHPSAW